MLEHTKKTSQKPQTMKLVAAVALDKWLLSA
jgi:hypothetical protein